MLYREILTPTEPDQIRSNFASHAKSILGLSAWPGDKDNRLDFEALLGMPPKGSQWDLDRPFRVWKDSDGNYHTEGISTCMLVAAGIMRRCGVVCPAFEKPYIPGSIPETIFDLAESCDAVRRTGTPLEGEIVVVGRGLGTHMFTIWQVSGNNHRCADGGSVEGGSKKFLQCVKDTWRVWPYEYVYRIDVASLRFHPFCSTPIPDNGLRIGWLRRIVSRLF